MLKILQYINDPICVLNEHWEFIQVNEAFEQQLGIKQKNLHGHHIQEVFEQEGVQKLYTKSWSPPVDLRLANPSSPYRTFKVNCIQEKDCFCLFFQPLEQKEGDIQFNSLYDRFFDLNPVAQFLVDSTLNIQKANQAFAKLVGIGQANIEDAHLTYFLYPDDHKKVFRAMHKIFKQQRLQRNISVRLEKNSGKVIWVDLTVSFLNTQEDQGSFAVCTVYDTTSYLEAEARLIASQNHLQVLFDSSIQAHIILDVQLEIQKKNKIAESLFAFATNSSTEKGKNILDLFETSDRKALTPYFQRTLQGEKLLIERRLHKGNSLDWYEMLFQPVRNEQNTVIGVSFSALNISERKATELEIAKLSMVARKTDNAVLITDSIGNVEWCNEGFVQMSGYQLSDVKGHLFWTLLEGKETDQKVLEKIKLVMTQRDTFKGELLVFTKEKMPYWIDLEVFPTFGREKKASPNFFVVQKNITRLKSNEQRLQKLNRSLEKHIAERNKIEQNLWEKNEELDNFIYRASHDLRGPLASLLGLYQLVSHEIKDPKALEFFEYYNMVAIKLDHLLMTLVNVTEIKGRTLTYSALYLTDIVNETLEDLAVFFPKDTVSIQNKVSLEVVMVTDERILRVVVRHLIQNAILYRKKKPDDFVKIQAYLSEDYKVMIEIIDNGIGIDEEMHDKIFDVFYKASERSKGSGIGLYLVKTALNRLDGEISLESQPEKGSTFRVTIPQKPLRH